MEQYKKVLMDEYQLRRLPKKRHVSSVDNLYHVLFYHWVYDDTVYRDERQRNYVATGYLMASYFGYRSVSIFDTRIKFEDEDDARKPADHAIGVCLTEDHKDNPRGQETPHDLGWDEEQAALVDSDSDPDPDNDARTSYDHDGDTNSDSGTDDGVNAGVDNTGKTFIVEREDNPLLYLLDHLLSLALSDSVFAAEPLRNISNIFRAEIPSGKKSLQLKIKRSALDTPVFREPGRAADEYRTSPSKPLRSKTWLRYLTRLGRNSGLEKRLTQYCTRRGLINTINNQAPSSVRD
ncbi:MAG: hypothetical protein Q9187_004151 [Circinaria calcarea]